MLLETNFKTIRAQRDRLEAAREHLRLCFAPSGQFDGGADATSAIGFCADHFDCVWLVFWRRRRVLRS